jgi:virginiamycin A acetyltransferase
MSINLQVGAYFRDSLASGPLWINSYSTVQRSKVGAYVTVGLFSFLSECLVGNYVSIGSRVSIGAFSHPINLFSSSEVSHRNTHRFFGESLLEMDVTREPGNTTLGHDVYVGDNAVILPGLEIGLGAVIGAGSVVTKDVEPFAVVVGNPARKMRMRFSDQKIQAILDTRWWELSISDLRMTGIWKEINLWNS